MLHYQVVRTSPGGATLSNKMNNSVHYGHVRHTLALMCAKNRFLDHPVQPEFWGCSFADVVAPKSYV